MWINPQKILLTQMFVTVSGVSVQHFKFLPLILVFWKTEISLQSPLNAIIEKFNYVLNTRSRRMSEHETLLNTSVLPHTTTFLSSSVFS